MFISTGVNKRQKGRGMKVLFLLLSGMLAFLLCFSPAQEEEKRVSFRDGYGVTEGTPSWQGETRIYPRRLLLQGNLMLVSPSHPLPDDFPAPDTRSVRAQVGAFLPAGNETLLNADTVYALCEMQLDCPLEDGAYLTDGALSYAQLEERNRLAFSRYARIMPLEEAMKAARERLPGGNESEHRLGSAVDLTLTGALSLKEENPLCRNFTGRWLSENMWRYGFIQRGFPRDGDEVKCENVHIRYVGKVHAAAMHVLDLGLEEYLSYLHRQGGITVLKGDEPWAYVQCVPCTDAFSGIVPPGAGAEVSADNTGYVIFTVVNKQKI